MEDLLQSQIKDSCKLALPDGLQELMCDISREVLRARPNNLYSFIADYLSALLVTRENMSIVTRLCDDFCAVCYMPELEDELRYLGLDEEGAASAKDIIVEYFNRGKDTINEGNLIMKLMKNTNLDVDLLPQVQTAVRNAFQRHQTNHTVIYETSSDSEKDETERAASHTKQLYRKTNPTDEDLNQKAAKIQAAYRAYGVRRNRGKRQTQKLIATKTIRKNITFESSTKVHNTTQLDEPRVSSTYYQNHNCILNTVSSTCLGGSYLQLPKHKPYSVLKSHDSLSEGENLEKEHEFDYAAEKVHKVTELNEERKVSEEHNTEDDPGSFIYEIEDKATEADLDSEGSVHEYIKEQFQNDGNVLTD